MKRLLLCLIALLFLSLDAFAAITTYTYNSPYGHYLKGTWTSTGAKSCISGIQGEIYKSWTVTITGTATVNIEGSPDNQQSFNTLKTYTQGSAPPIGGDAINGYTDWCIEITVCSGCTVQATISTGYAQVKPMP